MQGQWSYDILFKKEIDFGVIYFIPPWSDNSIYVYRQSNIYARRLESTAPSEQEKDLFSTLVEHESSRGEENSLISVNEIESDDVDFGDSFGLNAADDGGESRQTLSGVSHSLAPEDNSPSEVTEVNFNDTKLDIEEKETGSKLLIPKGEVKLACLNTRDCGMLIK